MRRGVVALLVAVVFGAFAPLAHAEIPPTQESTTVSRMNGTVRTLVIDSNGGDIAVKPAQSTTISRTEHWLYDRPRVRMRFSQGVLTVTSRCSNAPLNNCRVDIVAAI